MSAPVDVESYVRSFERNTGVMLDNEQRAEYLVLPRWSPQAAHRTARTSLHGRALRRL